MQAVYHYEYMDSFHINEFMRIGEIDFYRAEEPDAYEIESGIILPYKKTAEMSAAAGGGIGCEKAICGGKCAAYCRRRYCLWL